MFNVYGFGLNSFISIFVFLLVILQRSVVNQLKSDMEMLQEEMKTQMVSLFLMPLLISSFLLGFTKDQFFQIGMRLLASAVNVTLIFFLSFFITLVFIPTMDHEVCARKKFV